MKTLLSRLRGRRAPAGSSAGLAADGGDDSIAPTSLLPPDDNGLPMVRWAERATQIKARPFDRTEAAHQLVRLWRTDPPLAALVETAPARLAPLIEAAQVDAGQQPILQDEAGDYFLVLLEGRVVVERQHEKHPPTRLFEARAGDPLGEMALFDGGPRSSVCRTLTPCTLAVLDTAALQRLMADDPALAAALMASIIRRLSLRLRQAGARLSALLAPQ